MNDKTIPASARHQELLLPPATRETFENLRAVPGRLLHQSEDLFEEMGIATFMVVNFENDLLACGSSGCAETLRRLREIGFEEGTSLSEGKLGSTVVTEALRANRPAWCVGDENQLDALKDYALYAAPSKRGESYGRTDFILLCIMPREGVQGPARGVVEMYAMNTFLADERLIPQLTLGNLALETLMKRSATALMTVNADNAIIDLSDDCASVLGFDYLSAYGRPYHHVIPELEKLGALENPDKPGSLVTRIANGKDVLFRYMPLIRSGKRLGAIIFAADSNQIKQQSKAVNDTRSRYVFDDIAGRDETLSRAVREARRAAKTHAPLVIQGEEGTGKELLARAVHSASRQASGPFVVVECGSLVIDTAAAILFGSVDPPYAQSEEGIHIGKLEQANGGTLFLRNVDCLPLHVQPALANALRTRTVTWLGGSEERHFDARIIASTRSNLESMAFRSEFDPSLLYSLSVITLSLPPLRERSADIDDVAQRLLARIGATYGRKGLRISEGARRCLEAYRWPGNVRELQNALERAVVLEAGNEISAASLPHRVAYCEGSDAENQAAKEAPASPQGQTSYYDLELSAIVDSMKRHNGNKTKVAAELGISRNTLYDRLKKIDSWK